MNFAYNSGTTMTYAPIKYAAGGLYEGYLYPSNVSQYNSGQYSSFSSTAILSYYYLQYYNSSGVLSGGSQLYGPSYTSTTLSYSTSVNGNARTYNFNRPALSARCSTTYFTTDRAANIDAANSTLKYRIDVFKGPVDGFYNHRYKFITDICNNN